MNKLLTTLKTNAIFSGISGIVLIVLNHQVAKLFGTDNNSIFWIIGLALIFFAITIIVEVIKQRSLAILWVIIQDFLWVIGSILILVLNPFPISPTGTIIIGTVALIVLFMGLNQAKALTKIDNIPKNKGKQWRFERIVKAPPLFKQKNKFQKIVLLQHAYRYYYCFPRVD